MTRVGLPEPVSSDDRHVLRDTLFRPMEADGVYARTALYETVVTRLGQAIDKLRDPAAEVLRFPPVMSRRHLEKNGYLKSFPQLLGCACSLHGSEADVRAAAERGPDAWTQGLSATELVLTPAACYPVYPIAAAQSPLAPNGAHYDIAADCFRREPSLELDRLQSFRMREFVRIGTPSTIVAFREQWMLRSQEFAEALALPCRIEQASDPFFGRSGQMMAMAQIQQALKFEVVVPLRSEASPTACMSLNYHRDHFGLTWDIACHDGSVAHTSCIAFGMDRLTLALFWVHGLETRLWPARVRSFLDL